MSTYAIGDVQGCFDSLTALLEQIAFDPAVDRLWLAGDIVNRGPKSLETLRWARDLGDRVTMVLGNHELNLLATAVDARRPRRRDTLQPILEADDASELLGWLRTRPIAHRDGEWFLVHAGLHPDWTLEMAEAEARRIERALADGSWLEAWRLSRPRPPAWDPGLEGVERLAASLSYFVGARAVRHDGRLDVDFAGGLEDLPAGSRPWFEARGVDPAASVIFGHWAALGLHMTDGYICLDSGCVWGHRLSAYRLEDGDLTQQDALEG